ncbi:LamG domain-containing protein, partial [Kaarinaea lacus]
MITTLYGCGSGSGVENSPTGTGLMNDSCDGASDVEDCRGFRNQVWLDILARPERCAGCHVEGGSGTGAFGQSDILIAYEAVKANNRIDRNDPVNSFIVTKVRDNNHNCWIEIPNTGGQKDFAECGNQLGAALEAWLNPTSGGTNNQPSEDLGSVASRLEWPSVDTTPSAEQIVLGNVSPPATPGADQAGYETHVYNPIVSQYCSRCHSEDAPQAQRQQPYFADTDPAAAFNAVVENRKIDINNPANSRMYLRLAQDSHNCWSACNNDAAAMLSAIQAWNTAIINNPSYVQPVVEGTETTTQTTSQGLKLEEGQVIAGGQRVTAGQIALWEFKNLDGDNVAEDTSTVQPKIDLVLNDNVDWVGGWGIEFNPGGRATAASIADSQKLYDQIVTNNAFTMEAWVVPANVTQEGPAIIASYSFSDTERNFSLGQTLYSYEFLNRDTASGLDLANRANGQPTLITDPNDEDLQATQQHVVMTYDSVNGRRIYVNGQFTGDADTVTGGSLSDWDPSYVFTLGADVGGANQWLGKIRMVAIYNRALTQEEITQNFDAGVGQKYHLLFKVGHLSSNIPDTSYIWMEVAEFDDYSYLFSDPAFVVLDPQPLADGTVPALSPASIASLQIQGMRIGVNGRLASAGQAFLNMNESISMPDLTNTSNPRHVGLIGTTSATIDGVVTNNIPVRASGTIIAKQNGATGDTADQFYLTFENFDGIAGAQSQNGTPIPLNYAYSDPVAGLANSNYIAGIRMFEEINGTMSAVTGIGVTNPAVQTVFTEIQQQLPSGVALEGFLASHQIA